MYHLISDELSLKNMRYDRAFSSGSLDQVLDHQNQKIIDKITNEENNYILNVNETDYILHIFNEHKIEPLSLSTENISVSNFEKLIPANQFPSGYHVFAGKSYKKNVIVYHIPYKGDHNLLNYQPNHYIMWNPDLVVISDCICFELISFDDNPEEIKREADHITKNLSQQIANQVQQINAYNEKLPKFIESTLKSRKEKLLQNQKMLTSLGVPIKKTDNLPASYAIPPPNIRKSVTPKPVVKDKDFAPEPTLDALTYHEILQTIHDVGVIFERYPSTYKDKDEESLRDHFLLYLEPRFEGATSAETFNKTGKTDILIRHIGKNIFIAECKFWRGEKQYLATISQLLGYLTWRDSKSAIIIFVHNKDFSAVLSEIKEVTPKHPNYLTYVNNEKETWFNYQFHILDDRNREVKLAVLLFHIPN